jgi:hypothetical protein
LGKKANFYLDIRNFDADRASIRRLEKNLLGLSQFVGKKGRVFFFCLNDMEKINMIGSIIPAIRGLGYECSVENQKLTDLI